MKGCSCRADFEGIDNETKEEELVAVVVVANNKLLCSWNIAYNICFALLDMKSDRVRHCYTTQGETESTRRRVYTVVR